MRQQLNGFSQWISFVNAKAVSRFPFQMLDDQIGPRNCLKHRLCGFQNDTDITARASIIKWICSLHPWMRLQPDTFSAKSLILACVPEQEGHSFECHMSKMRSWHSSGVTVRDSKKKPSWSCHCCGGRWWWQAEVSKGFSNQAAIPDAKVSPESIGHKIATHHDKVAWLHHENFFATQFWVFVRGSLHFPPLSSHVPLCHGLDTKCICACFSCVHEVIGNAPQLLCNQQGWSFMTGSLCNLCHNMSCACVLLCCHQRLLLIDGASPNKTLVPCFAWVTNEKNQLTKGQCHVVRCIELQNLTDDAQSGQGWSQ